MHDPSGLASLAPQDYGLKRWRSVVSGWVYMLRCRDDSYYVGSTSHAAIETRVNEHNDGLHIGSYTYARRPVALVWSRRFEELIDAHDAERRIKGWSRAKKEALIAGDEGKLLALSMRRAGQPPRDEKPLSARELAHLAQSLGANKSLEVKARGLPSTRKPSSARPTSHLMPPDVRHPEVRAKRAPKDD